MSNYQLNTLSQSFVPYLSMPPRPPIVEQGNPGRLSTQSPLLSNGFLQNEPGALVAVYQPELSNQYMNVSGDVSHTINPRESGGQKYNSRPSNMYCPSTITIPTTQGWPNIGGQVTDARHSPNPFQCAASNLNTHFNRRPHGPPTQHSFNNATQNNNASRVFNSRPSQGYLQNTSNSRRGGQRGRPLSDWN